MVIKSGKVKLILLFWQILGPLDFFGVVFSPLYSLLSFPLYCPFLCSPLLSPLPSSPSDFPYSPPLFSSLSYSIQDISILFNLIIILLMLFNTYVFQVGLVALLLDRFRAMLMYSALYLTLSIILHSWIMVLLCGTRLFSQKLQI